MTIAATDFYPTHAECGKRNPKINDRDRSKLLFVGHIIRYCDHCRKSWLFTIGEEEKATLFGVV
jgi:hypothetical protein